MMLSALCDLPLSWNDWMPLSIYDPFPLHDVFFTSHFWPGLALLLVNGAPNIVGADAAACVKSTSYNMVKAGFAVHVISDCVTSYNLGKID